jgi:hypothetical protein
MDYELELQELQRDCSENITISKKWLVSWNHSGLGRSEHIGKMLRR